MSLDADGQGQGRSGPSGQLGVQANLAMFKVLSNLDYLVQSPETFKHLMGALQFTGLHSHGLTLDVCRYQLEQNAGIPGVITGLLYGVFTDEFGWYEQTTSQKEVLSIIEGLMKNQKDNERFELWDDAIKVCTSRDYSRRRDLTSALEKLMKESPESGAPDDR